MPKPVIQVSHLTKEYVLGQIGTGTLRGDIQSLTAKLLHKEDPNKKIWDTGAETKNGRFLAMDDVSFDVMPGDALGIIGHNGAGKSTLLKLISRITAPTGGEIRLKGRVSSLLEIGTGFHPELTGMENIYLNGTIMGLTRKEISARVDRIVDFSELEKFIDTPVKRYSSGMYVKLAFAVGAFLESDILICDEVLAVGDLAFQQKCIDRMREMAHSGKTVLYVSHNMRTIRNLCTRALVLERGRLVHDGSTTEAIDRYAAPMFLLDVDADHLPRGKNRGYAMRFLRVQMNHEDTYYKTDEQLDFTFTVRTRISEPHLHIRAMFSKLGERVVAASEMVMENNMSVTQGETFTYRMLVPLDRFAGGRYVVNLSVFSVTGGRPAYHDTIYDVFAFEVTNDAVTAVSGMENIDGAMRLDEIRTEIIQ